MEYIWSMKYASAEPLLAAPRSSSEKAARYSFTVPGFGVDDFCRAENTLPYG
jgi:hypothetical protein